MTKRKYAKVASPVPIYRRLKNYFRYPTSSTMPAATRRRMGTSKAKSASRGKKTIRRNRGKRSYRRRTNRKSRSGPSRSPIAWKPTNTATYTYDYADQWAVTAGGNVNGKQCKYGHVGQFSSTAFPFLLNIGHLAQIADDLQRASVNSFNGNTPPIALETKFFIKNCFQTHEIVNMSNGHTTLYAYKCVFRQDISYSFNGTAGANGYQSPINLLGDGFYQRGVTGLGRGRNNIGCTDCDLSPFDSHKFCSMVKILKTSKHDLDAGQIIKFSITKRRPVYINMDHYYTPNASNQTTFASLTPDYTHRKGEMFYLFRIEGQPSNGNGTGTLSTSIFYTSPKVNMITKTHYNATWLNPTLNRIVNNDANNYLAPVNVGDEVIMNDENGVKVQETNA